MTRPVGIYGICVVQNEGDVIRDSVTWAGRFCEKVWVWDLGSSDQTWEVLSGLASTRVEVVQRRDLTYSAGLRSVMVEELRGNIPEGAWVYILDADEFVVEDPRPLLERAAAAGADLVKVLHLDFYPTQLDLAKMEAMGEVLWSEIPLVRRLRSFNLNPWPERRFIRLTPGLSWTTSRGHNQLRRTDGSRLKVYRRKLLVRHYRYRSPAQVAHRYDLRRERRKEGYQGFGYDAAADFRAYCKPAEVCRVWREVDATPRIPWSDFVRCQAQRLRRRIWGRP